jgi:hypothetical protein
MIGNNSLQKLARSIVSASIVDIAVSVCSLEDQKTGQLETIITNTVQLLPQTGLLLSS